MIKRIGDAVFGSSMNQQGVLHVTARRVGKDTAISQASSYHVLDTRTHTTHRLNDGRV